MLVKNAQNLMHAVTKTLHAAESACMKVSRLYYSFFCVRYSILFRVFRISARTMLPRKWQCSGNGRCISSERLKRSLLPWVLEAFAS